MHQLFVLREDGHMPQNFEVSDGRIATMPELQTAVLDQPIAV